MLVKVFFSETKICEVGHGTDPDQAKEIWDIVGVDFFGGEIKTCEIIKNMRYVGVDLFLEIKTCGLNMELT